MQELTRLSFQADPCRPAEAWPRRTHGAGRIPADAPDVVLLGRLLQCATGEGILADETGEIRFRYRSLCGAAAGDVAALTGYARGGQLHVHSIQVLVSGHGALKAASDWTRFRRHDGLLRQRLFVRARIMAAIRDYFRNQGFQEVETPQFVSGTGNEGHIDFFESELRLPAKRLRGVLIASPEHHMKRLLSAGFERIFQLVRCFRNGERSPCHLPEFTMLEWYRAYADYHAVMEDVEKLVAYVCHQVSGRNWLEHGGQRVELAAPWPRLTVTEAYSRYAGISLQACPDATSLRHAAAAHGYRSITEQDSWEDAFHKVLVDRVEPGLKELGAVFLLDYPVALGALARRKPGCSGLAERAEAYIAGMELANGYSELNDAAEQEERFCREAQRRRAFGLPPVNTDVDFLHMLQCGMPPAGGMAMGVDRLVMLCTGATSIDEVVAFPPDLGGGDP